jgi:hypothetical protein
LINIDNPHTSHSKKQRRFVDEYLVDLNATQAAIRAGYSPRTAQEQSSRLLSNVMVQAVRSVFALLAFYYFRLIPKID